jgi:cell division septal protein FtsQ
MATPSRRKIITERPDQNSKIKASQLVFKLVLLVFLAVLTYTLFFSGFLQIEKFSIRGNSEISSKDIENIAGEAIVGKYLGVLEKNNWLFFPDKKVANILKDNFKKIRDVRIKRRFPDMIVLEIDERQTSFYYFLNGKIWAVDENGVAYEEISPESFGESNFQKTSLGGEMGNEVFLGKEIADRGYIEYISIIREELRDKLQIETENIFETPNIISRDVRVKTQNGWKVYFNTEISLEKEMETLDVFLKKSFKDKNIFDLEYVDLRVENKIFYKLKGESQKDAEGALNNTEVKGVEDKKVEEKKKKKK